MGFQDLAASYNAFEELLGYQALIPVLHCFFSYLASRLLGYHLGTTALVGVFALAPLLFDVPAISHNYQQDHPLVVYLLGWGLVGTALLGIRMGLFLKQLLGVGSGLLSSVFSVSLIVSLVIISAMYFSPTTLNSILPGWQGSLGMLLLTISLLALIVTSLRFIKAGALIAAWMFVCVVVGTEVFLGKLPHEVVSEDLRVVPEFIPQSEVGALVDSLDDASGSQAADIVLLGGDRGGVLTSLMQAYLGDYDSSEKDQGLSVVQLGSSENSSFELLQMAGAALEKLRPKVVVFGNWLSDTQPAAFVPGHGQLSDVELNSLYERRKKLAQLPFVETIYESRLFHYLMGTESSDSQEGGTVRVNAAEYREIVQRLAGEAKKISAKVLLFMQPGSESRTVASVYQSALRQASSDPDVWYSGLDNFRLRSNYDLLFKDQRRLTQQGYLVLASDISNSLNLISTDRKKALHQANLYEWRVPSQKLRKDLLFRITPEASQKGYYRVVFSVNGKFVGDKRFVGSAATSARFRVPERYLTAPYLKLQLFGYRESDVKDALIGDSNIPLLRRIEVSTERNGGFSVRHPDILSISELEESDPLQLVVFEPGTGEIQTARSFADTEEEVEDLIAKVKSLEWGTPVLLAKSGELRVSGVEELSSALKYFGADPENWKELDESFASIGVAGLRGVKASSVADKGAPMVVGLRKRMPMAVKSNLGSQVVAFSSVSNS